MTFYDEILKLIDIFGPSYPFDQLIKDTVIIITDEAGNQIARSLIDSPWSDGYKYYGLSHLGDQEWYSAKVDSSDYKDESYVGAKSEIHWPMFFMAKENYHSTANGWPSDAKVIVVDGNFHGSFKKEVLINELPVHTYHPTANDWSGTSCWIHYNVGTREAKDLG